MKRFSPNPWLVVAFIGGVIYPPLVYYGMSVFPPMVFVSIGLALIGLRLWGTRRDPDARIWQIAFFIAAFGLTAILFLDAAIAVKIYPVVVSLSVASIFGLSLLFPPTVVERIARLTEPDLPPSGVIYTRKVTAIWAIFLVTNALVSAATSLWGTMAQWTLWNGLLSYLLMGMLFIGEWFVRKRARQ